MSGGNLPFQHSVNINSGLCVFLSFWRQKNIIYKASKDLLFYYLGVGRSFVRFFFELCRLPTSNHSASSQGTPGWTRRYRTERTIWWYGWNFEKLFLEGIRITNCFQVDQPTEGCSFPSGGTKFFCLLAVVFFNYYWCCYIYF